ncbi:MAG: site-2 protease family protein [Patescibacteria group bacterium]|nr:site-2 protease family protein [Patescibacteria group bacterium]
MELILSLIIILFSAVFHEVAHGYVADRLGDPTARLMGRLTLDPRKHIDPMYSILFPLILALSGLPVIAAAKPVPVDPFNLKEGRKDMALVSLAGPLTNIIIAVLASFILKFLSLPFVENSTPYLLHLVLNSIFFLIVQLNLLLAIFNLIPIPPLDGSKIFSLLLPEEQAASYLSLGSFGMIIIFFLLFFPIGGFSLGDLIFRTLLPFATNLLIP